MIPGDLLDTSFDHKAGLSNFPIKHLCHSSDILVAHRSDKNSSYFFSRALMETSIQALCFAFISFTETHSASRRQYQKMEAFSPPLWVFLSLFLGVDPWRPPSAGGADFSLSCVCAAFLWLIGVVLSYLSLLLKNEMISE